MSTALALSDLLGRGRLTPVQRRIAAHVLAEPGDVAFLSSVQLAERVGVSQPSVTRLAGALGFASYGEMQNAVRAIAFDAPVAEEPAGNKLQQAVDHSVDALRALQELLADPGPVRAAAKAMSRSKPLAVYGTRASAALAAHFAYFARRVHPDVRLLDGSPDSLLEARLAGASCLLAIVMPRYPRDAAGVIRDCGLEVVLVTDTRLSPLAEHAEHVLPAPVTADLVFDTPVAATQLLAILLEALADAAPTRSQRRLDEFETGARGAFLDDDSRTTPRGSRHAA